MTREKAGIPHDHNRDYTEKPLYRTVTAVKKLVESSNVITGFDFYSPWKWGDRNDQVFFVKCGSSAKEESENLGRHLWEVTGSRRKTGDIVYTGSEDVEMGISSASIISVRETRHFKGEYTLTGPGVGVAAALSAQKGVLPRKLDVKEIQNVLIKTGVCI